jgi:hypothetical protein
MEKEQLSKITRISSVEEGIKILIGNYYLIIAKK